VHALEEAIRVQLAFFRFHPRHFRHHEQLLEGNRAVQVPDARVEDAPAAVGVLLGQHGARRRGVQLGHVHLLLGMLVRGRVGGSETKVWTIHLSLGVKSMNTSKIFNSG